MIDNKKRSVSETKIEQATFRIVLITSIALLPIYHVIPSLDLINQNWKTFIQSLIINILSVSTVFILSYLILKNIRSSLYDQATSHLSNLISDDVVKKLEILPRIERSLLDNSDRIINSLAGVEVKAFTTSDDAFDYLSQGLLQAKLSVYQCALASSVPISRLAEKTYNNAISTMLQENVVIYRYIAKFDKPRWERTKLFLLDESIRRYHVGSFDIIEDIPMISFAIIDEKEVIVRQPYESDEREVFLSVKHPEIVKLFLLYHQSLWKKSNRLYSKDRDKIEKIEKRFVN